MTSVCARCVPQVQCLLALGATATARDQYGRTPLHLAAREDRAGVLLALVAAGHPVDVADSLGATALMMAARHGHEEAVRARGVA